MKPTNPGTKISTTDDQTHENPNTYCRPLDNSTNNTHEKNTSDDASSLENPFPNVGILTPKSPLKYLDQ